MKRKSKMQDLVQDKLRSNACGSGFFYFLFDNVHACMRLFQRKILLLFVTYLPWPFVLTRLPVQLVMLFNITQEKSTFPHKMRIVNALQPRKLCVGMFEMHGKSLVFIEKKRNCVLTPPAKICTLIHSWRQWMRKIEWEKWNEIQK